MYILYILKDKAFLEAALTNVRDWLVRSNWNLLWTLAPLSLFWLDRSSDNLMVLFGVSIASIRQTCPSVFCRVHDLLIAVHDCKIKNSN